MRKKKTFFLLTTQLFLVLIGCKKNNSPEPYQELTWVKASNVEMPVLYAGNREGNTVLLVVHGGPGGSSILYLPILRQYFGNDILLALWDQRYAGFSKHEGTAPNRVEISEYGDDCTLVVDEIRSRFPGKKVVIWGQSWGGIVVTEFITRPGSQGKYDGWIVVNGNMNGFETTQAELSFAKRRCQDLINAGQTSYKDTLDILNTIKFNPNTYNPVLQDKMTSIKINLSIPGEPNLEAIYREGLDREVRPLFAQEDFERFNQNLALPLLTSLFPEQTYYFNRNSLYQNIDKPGLLLWGENDETLPIEAARVFSQNLAAANVAHQLVTVPNSWHVPFYDSPEVHHREVMQFISSKL